MVADPATKPSAPTSEIGYASGSVGWWSAESNFEEQTPELRWPDSVRVYDAMRRQDAQVASVLRAVTLPVRRTKWRIDPNGARPEVAQQIADDFGLPLIGAVEDTTSKRTRDRFSWAEHLQLALLMAPFGFMPFEQVYRIDAAGMARLRKLAPRMPRSIARFHVAADGGLESIEQYAPPTASALSVTIPVNRLVMYVLDREGGNWTGSSLLRSGYKNWLLKDRLLRVQTQTIQRNGMGVPLYKGQPGATPEDLATGKTIATAWRSGDTAGASIPNGADMLLRGVEGALPDALPAINYHDAQIARGVLAHFLNLGTQTGSWALGTTFADFFTMSLQTLAETVADVANQHVVEDLIDVNYGPDEPAPRLVFDEIGSRHDATAMAVQQLVSVGALQVDEPLRAYVRNTFGIPDADPNAPDTPPVINPVPGDMPTQMGDQSVAS